MITLNILSVLENAQSDLDDMDFTALWGKEEGLELFCEYDAECNRNLVEFISNMSDERKKVFIDYINDQFTT